MEELKNVQRWQLSSGNQTQPVDCEVRRLA